VKLPLLNAHVDCARLRASGGPASAHSSTRPKEVDVAKHEIDIGRLEKSISTVRDRLEVVAQSDDLAELIKLIRKPGWTTPAEFMLVHGVVETIGRQIDVIEHLQRDLLAGSRAVAAEGVHTTV
jgi:hypothetical protein